MGAKKNNANNGQERDIIQAFYERNPYPFKRYLSREKIAGYAAPLFGGEKRFFETTNGKTILDIGCGTGEITCSLSTHAKGVKGIDISTRSITLAEQLAKKIHAKQVSFQRADLFDYFSTEKVDVVTAFGSLHHSRDPRQGFLRIAKWVKPNGLLVVGFYHSLGGWRQRAEKIMSSILGGVSEEEKISWLEKKHRTTFRNSQKAYWLDRVANPREKYYRVSTIETWFRKAGFEITHIQGQKPQSCVSNPASILEKWGFEIKLFLRGQRFVIMSGKKLE